ncbi:MAG: hypothetical protein KJ607_09535, partial [Bacteroidetes bacterium]|nr:hypothetical protein [Bacteroidota bacterium]
GKMKTSDGRQSLRIISGLSLNPPVAVALEIAILLGIGITAALLHARFRFPLNIPGRHGLDFMMLIMAGRLLSRFRYAATVTVIGAALTTLIPGLGFTDAFLPVYFIGAGIILDVMFPSVRRKTGNIVALAAIGGLAFMIIPIARYLVYFAGYPYVSILKHGPVIPLLTHFVFGAAGALVGAGAVSLIGKLRKKN